LIHNAADAISAGDSLPRMVKVRAFSRNAQFVSIAISDTGKGIDPNDVDRIFEPLFTTKENGAGMGLSIVRSIVESHGGEIHVCQGPESGATFEFTVPAAS